MFEERNKIVNELMKECKCVKVTNYQIEHHHTLSDN